MEFASDFDESQDIVTYRTRDKWGGRIKKGDVIEIARIHTQRPWRGFRRVISVVHAPHEDIPHDVMQRLCALYLMGVHGKGNALPAMLKITLRHEEGLGPEHPDLVRWK